MVSALLTLSFGFHLIMFSVKGSLMSVLGMQTIHSGAGVLSASDFSIGDYPVLFFR